MLQKGKIHGSLIQLFKKTSRNPWDNALACTLLKINCNSNTTFSFEMKQESQCHIIN